MSSLKYHGAEAKTRELRADKNIYLQEKEVHHWVSLGNIHPLPWQEGTGQRGQQVGHSRHKGWGRKNISQKQTEGEGAIIGSICVLLHIGGSDVLL